jgi:hypothetical protein
MPISTREPRHIDRVVITAWIENRFALNLITEERYERKQAVSFFLNAISSAYTQDTALLLD